MYLCIFSNIILLRVGPEMLYENEVLGILRKVSDWLFRGSFLFICLKFDFLLFYDDSFYIIIMMMMMIMVAMMMVMICV